MMNLTTYKPSAPLSHFVNEFWLCEDYLPAHAKERILPGGVMELVFLLSGTPPDIYYGANLDAVQPFRGALVAGARSEYFVIDTARPATVLGVYFKPGVSLPFFKVPARELHNLHVPLDTLWGLRGNDLYCQLLEARTSAQRFRILENALLAQLRNTVERHRAVDFALAAFNQGLASASVAQVTDQIGLSATRFIQVFGEEIGLTPKLYRRVLRFQEALRSITQQPTRNWTDIALSCGYFDQSHFINDFQAFAGISPSLYFPPEPEHPGNLGFVQES